MTENSPKIKKKSNLQSKHADFPQELRKKFFSRLCTRFDPLLAILLVLGGRAYIGELGKKDLEKNLKN